MVFSSIRYFLIACVTWLALAFPFTPPAQAAGTDPYVFRYLRVTEPVAIPLDDQGNTKLFSGRAISEGKQLFEENCKGCHVAGTTLPNPMVSLSLTDLRGATPSRASVNRLVDYFRHPMTYDGSEDALFCRQISERWLSQTQVENLAAFILRAAEKAPGWGTNDF